MAPQNINYENVFFYKLCCKDLNIKDIYVGHTTNFTIRKSKHKRACCNESDRCHNYLVYKFIREHGGWDNWEMILIENDKCDGVLDARKKERLYIEEFNGTLNINIPSRTPQEYEMENAGRSKEYYEKNKEIIKIRHKSYYDNNKAQVLQRHREHYQLNKDKERIRHKVYYEQNKEAINLRIKTYDETHPDKAKERRKAYKERNKDTLKEQNKEYYELNKDRIKERMKNYEDLNKDRIRERKNKYRELNKDKINERLREWRARKKLEQSEQS